MQTANLIHTATGQLEVMLPLPADVSLIEVARAYLRSIGKSPLLAENFHFAGLQR